MKRIYLVALLTITLAGGLAAAAAPKDLATAKAEFGKVAHPDEAARVQYVLSLAQLREKLAKSNGAWEAVDAELRKHPTPKDVDGKALTKLREGSWTSPRHDYLYRKNGTWVMLPDEPNATSGSWRIEGNQSIEAAGDEKPRKYTIILLTGKNYIFTDGEVVFYEVRKGK